MATVRQEEANRRNASRSTGPKTDEGKLASRTNAFKHGLSGSGNGAVCVSAASSELAERMERWRPSYAADLADGPFLEEREFLFEQIVLNSLRIESAQKREVELIEGERRHARVTWQSDQAVLAESLGAKLGKAAVPSLLIAKLWTFLQGIQWMINAWSQLKQAIETSGDVDEGFAKRLRDLQGISREVRETLPPLKLDEALKIIDGELAKFGGDLLQSFETLDREDRRAAEAGYPREISKEERLNRRYEDQAHRRYQQARAGLRELSAMIATSSSFDHDLAVQSFQKRSKTFGFDNPELDELIEAFSPDERTLKFLSGELDLKAEAEAVEAEWKRQPEEAEAAEEEQELTDQDEDDSEEEENSSPDYNYTATKMAKERRKRNKAQRQSRKGNRRRR